MQKNKKELQNRLLTKEQCETVSDMIVTSMRDVYTDKGSMPNDGFNSAAGLIADKIIKNTQMALMQNAVYTKAVKESKPLKNKKNK